MIFGDFFEECKNIPKESIDLIVTDPPYFILNEQWDKGNFTEFTNKWLGICRELLKPGGTIWSFMSYERHYEYHEILSKYFTRNLKNDIVWCRAKGRSSAKHLKSLREDVYFACKDGNKVKWNELKVIREVIAPYMLDGRPRGWFVDETGKRVRWTGLGNVHCYSSPVFSSINEKQWHPAQKPIMLIERLIRLSSNENDLVFDPFFGVGTTPIACKLSNRRFVGCEFTEKYYKIAKERVDGFDYKKFIDYNVDIGL